MVFQEQLSQAAIHLAGFDPAEADTLRKVVSKKHREKKLRDFHARFVKGARARGVDRKVTQDVWEMMMGFDGYSFCKPHSASYTLVAYKSAYLRAHHPAEFMAAVISNGGGYYSTFGYISEARRMGLRILPPDINTSAIKYTGRARGVRIGLMQLKELGQEAKEAVIHERSKNGLFLSLEDFLKRTSRYIHLQDVRILIKAGCFDAVARGESRPALMWRALRFFDNATPRRCPGLFESEISPATPSVQSPPAPPFAKGGDGEGSLPFTSRDSGLRHYPEHIMRKHELDTLGFLLSIHPLESCRDVLQGLDYVEARDLASWVGKRVTTVGWMVTSKTTHTKEGDPMKFVSFEDTTGLYETVFFPKVYHRHCHMLSETRSYILKGRVDEDFGAVTMTVDWIGFLDRH
jgi:error-prone DNA polymerase